MSPPAVSSRRSLPVSRSTVRSSIARTRRFSSTRRGPAPAQPRGLTAARGFWCVLGCIAFSAMYFCKAPAKKALADAGICEMTGAQKFWYVLQGIAFGAGYFAKLPFAKTLSEIERYR